MTSQRDMQALTQTISSNQTILSARAHALNVPLPTFEHDPAALYSDAQAATARKAIEDAAAELHALAQGPMGLLTQPAHNYHASLHALAKFDMAAAVPLADDAADTEAGGVPFAQLAAKCGLDEALTKRLVKTLITQHVFIERPPGIVRHSAASRYLAATPQMRQWLLMVFEEMWPAATKLVEAVGKFSPAEAQEPECTPYALAHRTDKGLFGVLAGQPERSQRFADAMTWFATGPGLEVHHLVDGFAWVDAGVKKVVDVGGSFGSASIAIAKKYPQISCVVQDRPEVVEAGRAQLASDTTGVTFQVHDFFDEQPVKDADIYLLRMILHDWSDLYAARILRALVPALEARGGSILVMEQMVPEPGVVSTPTERMIRSFDMAMMAICNGRERDVSDWTTLVASADARLKIKSVVQPPMSRMAIIQITLS